MDYFKKIWALSFKAQDVKNLVIAIVIYVVANIVIGWLLGLLGVIPFVGFVFDVIGSLVGLYCAFGIILAVLAFLKVLK